jgi:bacteriorhodopsin
MVEAGAKDWLFSITGMVGLLAFLFLVTTIVFREVPEHNETIFTHLIGIVEGVALMIFSFYFGGIKKGDK